MSEAIADAPETTTTIPPQQPLTAPLNPSLQKLMERVLPVDGDAPEGDPEPSDKPEATDKPEGTDGQPEPKPENKPKAKPEPSPASDLRLAPDFSAPEKKDEPKPEEIEITDEMIAAEKSPKKQADLKKFRQAFNDMKAENLRLKTAQPEKTDDPGAQAIIDQQAAQITELSGTVERIKLEAHPKFQQDFVRPRNAMMAQAQQIVKDAGGDEEALERAQALTGKAKVAALDDIVAGVESPVLRARLERLLDGIEEKNQAIEHVLKDAKGATERLSRAETIERHKMLEQQEQQLKSLLGAARRELADNLKLEVLHKTGKPEFKWWDEQVDEIDATAQEILLKATPDKMAMAAYLAAAAGPLRAALQAERRAHDALKRWVAEMDEADPGTLKGDRKPEPQGDFAPDADITQVALARLRRGDFKTAT